MREPFRPDAVEAFHYVGWDFDAGSGVVRLRYALDALEFEERFSFPLMDHSLTGRQFEHAVTVLHLCAGTSYYKAAGPPVITGVPQWAERFVRDLYLNGLAEYSMQNGLEPVTPILETVSAADEGPVWPRRDANGPALVAVGGGKDSIVTIESVRRSGQPFTLASVGTHRAIEETAAVGVQEHLVIGRMLDRRLLELNECGARNGHVPVTAINSAALCVVAVGLGAAAVVMSNESSASVPTTSHRGQPVNHQWSKSLAFERALSAIVPVPYFSLLRPLHEVEISRRFAGLTRYFGVVTSCNQAYTAIGRAAGLRWCGDCPKCRFVFLGLSAFLPPSTVAGIFDGLDLLADPAGIEPYRAILGLGGEPPMECVGTARESRWAMARLTESKEWSGHLVVRALALLVDDVGGWDPIHERGEHSIPPLWEVAADALA